MKESNSMHFYYLHTYQRKNFLSAVNSVVKFLKS